MDQSVLTVLKLGFVALLYIFFFGVLSVVWAQLRPPAKVPAAAIRGGGARRAAAGPEGAGPPAGRSARPAAAASARATRLVAVEPPDHRGKPFPLTAEMTVGRAAGCGVSLPSDTTVSQLHARIFTDPEGRLMVEDLGSTNGTWLNRRKVTAPTGMRVGDRLQVGATVLEVSA